MKRFLVFALLAPPIVLLLGALFLEAPWTWKSFAKGIYFTYGYGVIPSLAVGGLDWALRKLPYHWPLVSFVGGSISMGLTFLVYGFEVAFMIGAVPTAICSLLSSRILKETLAA